jgi:hypothetical protein
MNEKPEGKKTETRTKAKPKAKIETIYRMKVTLKGSKPPIWRRIEVPANITLAGLDRVIQAAMGWDGAHLHQFLIDGEYYSDPRFELDDIINENQVRLDKLVPFEKSKFLYEYDFGDDWQHTILVEKILPAEDGKLYPLCVTGKRACPPEDVGGIWGYEEFLEAIGDPKHPEHESMLEWVGGSHDPEAFDLEAVNALLRRTR